MSAGWRLVKLSEVCEIQRGGSPRPISDYITDAEDGINWIKIGDVPEGAKYLYTTKEKIKPEGAKRSRKVKPGDFLLSNSMSFGRPYILRTSGCIHDGWLVLKDKENQLNEDYLYHVLSSDFVYAQFKKFAVGAVVKNLNIEVVEKVEIPLPALSEQIRIAAILDQADALRVKRREALAQLDSLTQSIFIEMFGDPIANPFNFPLVPISDIVSNGRSKVVLGDGEVWNLNLDQIEPNTGRILQKVRSTTDKLGTSTFVFQTGTVLYSKLRPYLNKVVVADENGVATTELVPLKCIETLTKPAFLAYFLRSKRFVDFATETVAGAKMPRMMMDAFWSYQLPLPPISLQNSFNGKIKVIEKQRGIQLQSATEFDNLFTSLQHRAFRGEL